MTLKILVKSKLCAEFAYEEDDNIVEDEDYEPEYDVKNTVTKKLRKLKKVEENSSNDVGSEAFKTLETDLNAFQGAKYLGFFSSRSLTMREKYISLAQLVLLSLYIFMFT